MGSTRADKGRIKHNEKDFQKESTKVDSRLL